MVEGVPQKDDEFKIHPMNFLNFLKGAFCGGYKP